MAKNNILASAFSISEDIADEARRLREVDTSIGRTVKTQDIQESGNHRDQKIDDALEEAEGIIQEVPDIKEDQKKSLNERALDFLDRL